MKRGLLLEVDGILTHAEADAYTNSMEVIYALQQQHRDVKLKDVVPPQRFQVLKLLHLHNGQISVKLNMSQRSVASHIDKLFKQFGKTTRTAVAIEAAKYGIYNE